MSEIATKHGQLRPPLFMPDATRGAVRCIGAEDLEHVDIRALMVNSYHVMMRPGTRVISRYGGLHGFIGWDRPIVTDSGGFQVFSLIRQDPKLGTIRPKGVLFRHPETGDKLVLTPEKSIQTQFRLGSDVMVALDDCTSVDLSDSEQQLAVDRTIAWGRRAHEEFERQLAARKDDERGVPVLVGVVQGGRVPELRRECAAALVDAGYQAFGYGGWPIDSEGVLQLEMFALLRECLPEGAPFFALGVGKPEHLVAISELGLRGVFDSSLPTRDARHHRLYAFTSAEGLAAPFYEHVYIADKNQAGRVEPVSSYCDAVCCRRYSAGYLHHLIKVDDPLAKRLCTIHNLRFYAQLCERLHAVFCPSR